MSGDLAQELLRSSAAAIAASERVVLAKHLLQVVDPDSDFYVQLFGFLVEQEKVSREERDANARCRTELGWTES